MGETEWEEVPVTDEPPEPRCEVGPAGHEWHLSISQGSVAIGSGCAACDMAVDIDDIELYGITGRLRFEADHPNLGGWHYDRPCDCNWWWVFEPTPDGEDNTDG